MLHHEPLNQIFLQLQQIVDLQVPKGSSLKCASFVVVSDGCKVSVEVIALVLLVVVGLNVEASLSFGFAGEVKDSCFGVCEHSQRRTGGNLDQQAQIVIFGVLF